MHFRKKYNFFVNFVTFRYFYHFLIKFEQILRFFVFLIVFAYFCIFLNKIVFFDHFSRFLTKTNEKIKKNKKNTVMTISIEELSGNYRGTIGELSGTIGELSGNYRGLSGATGAILKICFSFSFRRFYIFCSKKLKTNKK